MPPAPINPLIGGAPEVTANPLAAGPQAHAERRQRAPLGPAGATMSNPLLGARAPSMGGTIAPSVPPPPVQAPPSAPLPVAMGADPPGTGSPFRISTRVPYAVRQTVQPHARNDLTVGLEASRASGDAYAKNADIIRNYDDIRTQRLKDPDAIHERLINHAMENLRFLHDKMGSHFDDGGAIRERSKLWYDGANVIARRMADEHGIHPHQAAGVLAALSPQTDWFQNVSRAERILNIRSRLGNQVATPEMETAMQRLIGGQKDEAVQRRMQGALDNIRGKPFHQIDNAYDQALFARGHEDAMKAQDPTHMHYRVVTPEGGYGDWSKTKSGKNTSMGWGSQGEITRAFEALKDAGLPNVSQAMGKNHKVRNFYNNIIAPNDTDHGDVTIDTHAIAAAHLRPYAGEDFPVAAGLGLKGSPSAATGSRGLYGAYAEAYRRTANELGIKPRQLQSITWEGLRGLFSPEQKRNKALVAEVDRHADDYKKGRIDGPTYRARIFDTAGGIARPEWARPDPAGDAGPQHAAHPQDVSGDVLAGGGPGAARAGARGGIAGRVPAQVAGGGVV
jgi:hypothetical protein